MNQQEKKDLEQLCCWTVKWLKDKIWDNSQMTSELNSELISVITSLANKLWLYASEKAQPDAMTINEYLDEDNVINKVILQTNLLYSYRGILRDLRTIVEQI